MHKLKTRKYAPIQVAIVAVIVGAGLIVTSALASNGTRHGSARRPDSLAVFTHPPTAIAHVASANSIVAPDAKLATVVGSTEVYVDQPTSGPASGRDCVTEVTNNSGAGACGTPSEVETEGMVTVNRFQGVERIIALLPNEVTSVTITDRDGATYEVQVKSNVIEQEDNNAATLTYGLSGGVTHTTEVAKLLSSPPPPPTS